MSSARQCPTSTNSLDLLQSMMVLRSWVQSVAIVGHSEHRYLMGKLAGSEMDVSMLDVPVVELSAKAIQVPEGSNEVSP